MSDIVLLVDDDPDMLDLLVRLLRREPYSVRGCTSGEEALATVAREEIAVIVVDERMPGLSGTDLLARLCTSNSEIVRIMLTGSAAMDVAVGAINSGHVFRFLQKPIRANDLRSAIREALFEADLQRAGSAPPFEARRAAALVGLERQWRGVTRIERDAEGVLLLPEEDGLEEALRAAAGIEPAPGPRGD